MAARTEQESREVPAPGMEGEPPNAAPTAPPPPRRRKAPLTTVLCALYIVAIGADLILMRLAGERWWFATLLLFSPRWLFAAPLIVLLPMALLFRRRLVIPLALAGLVVLFGIMGFRIPWRRALPSPAAAGPPSLRIFSCNLHGSQANPALLEQLLAEQRPDVILYQDYTPARQPSLVRTGGWRGDRWNGVYLASRFPFHRVADLLPRDAAARAYASHGWPVGDAVCYAIDLPGAGQKTYLINVHLASAHQQIKALRDDQDEGPVALQADSDRRGYESMTVAAAAAHLDGPVVIAGDFNTPDDSPVFRLAWHRFDDAFQQAGFGFGITYASHHTWLRIDHVLYDGTWRCRACQVGPPIGSGHRPVMTMLER